jgi:agmatinase
MNENSDSKAEKIRKFDPDGVGNTNANIFGLPFTIEDADVVIMPVPWDVTVSNMVGTSGGPENIFRQSAQIDLYDEFVPEPWKAGIAMEKISGRMIRRNNSLRPMAEKYIHWLEQAESPEDHPEFNEIKEEINRACEELCEQIKSRSLCYIKQNKLPVILGGDHSTPLGLIMALAEKHKHFALLQIDAHADLRPAYEGFTHSHASIMYNAMKLPQISHFVQVGLRDFCSQELQIIKDNPQRMKAFFARDIHRRLFEGDIWKNICEEIIRELPEKVYISFDIDGLEPAGCPGTGTPVPGGLSYNQVLYLFEQIALSGKTIIGFDLVETGTGQLDGIIACRILYKTIAIMLKSNGKV